MPASARAHAQPLTEETLKEIEAAALSGYHETVIQEFQNDPPSFTNFKALKYLEFNARSLAKDYESSVKKNLVPHNEHLVSIANRCANRSNYEIIMDAEKNKQYLRNERMLEMLIKCLKDCQNAAKILATHRSKARENAVQEQLLSGNAVIQQHTIHIPRMQQQLDLLMGKMELNQMQPAAVQRQHLQQMNNVQQNVSVENPPTYHANQQHPVAAAQNPNAPEWISRIPRQDCESLRNSCQDKDSFIRAFALKLFTKCEILEPLNELPAAKQNEAKNVVQHFFGIDANWDALFAKIMKSLRTNKRHNVFKKINKNQIGYGICNTGIVNFYFRCPLSNAMECFSNENCNRASRLATQPIGNFKVPTRCGDFDYILFIAKPERYASFNKLFKDGRMMKLPN